MTEKIPTVIPSNEESLVVQPDKNIGKKENSIEPEDFVFVQSTKSLTGNEIVTEMKKQGLRPATLKEMMGLLKPKKTGRIEPKDTDIVIEDIKTPKELNG